MTEQRTDEWLAQRAGKFTGSKFADLLARNKKTGEPLKAYRDLIWQVVVERMSGQPVEGPDGYALQWGTDLEAFARQEYELLTGNTVEEVGFIQHPLYDFCGVSPDGLIGDYSGIEIKCPKSSAIHLERYISGVPEEYIPQIQGCMWVTNRARWNFVSYDPRMPESHRMLVIEVKRDDEFCKRLEDALIKAEEEAQALIEQLTTRKAA